LQDVSSGILDVVMAPSWVLFSDVVSEDIYNLKISPMPSSLDLDSSIHIAFQVSRNHPELVTILNKFIYAFKLDRSLDIRKKWFGDDYMAITQLLATSDKSQEKINTDIEKVNDFLKLPTMPGLSNKEVGFLKKTSEIKISVNSNWLPFSIYDREHKKRQGLTFDYLDQIEKKLNLEFKYFGTRNKEENRKLLMEKKVDLHATSIMSGQDSNRLLHTSPYGTYHFSYVVHKKKGKVAEQRLKGKQIGVSRNHPYVDFIMKAYPDFKIVKLPSLENGLRKVNQGEIFAYIDLDPVLKYQLRKKVHPDLHLGGQLSAKTSMAFALHKDSPEELITIINKAFQQISNFDRKLIEDQWFSLKVQVEEVTDYTTLIVVLCFTGILTIFFVYWNGKLSRLNQVIKEKESLSRSLLESTNAVPYHFDFLQGKFTYIAPQITKVMGRLPQDFYHYEDWAMVIHPDEREKIFEVRKSAIEHRSEEFMAIYRIKNKNNKYIWIKEMASIIYERRHAVHMQGLFLDITLEKNQAIAIQAAKEAAESANQSKSQFLANMSHEIRTPLNPIIGLAHLALTTNPNPDQVKDYMSKIHSSSKSLLRIINDILDFSKMEAEKMNLEEIPFDLNQLNERINSLYGVKATEKNIELKFNKDDDVHPYVLGDPLRLEQVIGNLISNAIKFTDEGSVTLNIKKVSEEKGRKTLRFEVTDTGMGIPEGKLQKVFEAFSQADDSNTRTHGGTGLGLNICKKIVGMMGGKIEAESAPGKGSKFYFSLTFKTVSEEDCDHHHHLLLSKNKHPRFKKTKILLAEDNMINKQVAEELLRIVNLEISHVRNGQECVEAVQNGDYELILMDIQMPVMDGFEATKRIRSEKRFKDLPIIAMTAQAFASEKRESFAAGMNAHVTKPIDPQDLYETLSKYISIEEMVEDESSSAKASDTAVELNGKSHLLDVSSGVKRLRGNRLLYEEIVEDFYQNYEDFLDDLNRDFENQNTSDACTKLHQLKGAAGNIGAGKLFQISSELETCLKNQAPFKSSYEMFQDQFKITFELIHDFIQNKKTERHVSKSIESKPDDMEGLMQQLVDEIKNASPDALYTVEKLELIVDADQKDFIMSLKSSLKDFDFSSAAQKISDRTSA
jgi:signal transduction histidine kinase/CheY-like chemotaxis protein/ABC-type amino acid transport substrate-binding protein